MQKIAILIFFFSSLSQFLIASSVIALSAGKSLVVFNAVGRPSMLKISGKSSKTIEGSLEFDGKQMTGTVSFDVASLSTGISLRDDHMKNKYLEIAKYPKASLTFTDLKTAALQLDNANFKGTLSLHGVSKPIEGTISVASKGDSADIKATFSIDLSEYKIPEASFSGITMAKQVNLMVTATAPIKAASSP